MVPSGSRAIRGGRRLREMAGFGSPDGQRHLGINPGQRITPALESATTRRKLVRVEDTADAVDGGHDPGPQARGPGLHPDDPNALLLLAGSSATTDSDAILRVLAGFGGIWRVSMGLRLIPRTLRDPAYRWLARNRYRWFGRSEACWLPAAEHAGRFLD